ncbi:MAG: bifunctional 4-hydroxy-3-methylbut-2-enyl diphosphate reductase/30S ribosomal protein S1 [Clostridiales bacterium]|nr:bifunctional 4-hydroxy-3-methylbut-2-enyl diphosphate reductase/30S ribosomal protein S1 [Clostridiales bacterium]
MSRITVAKTAGFCFGVNRAVEMTYQLLAQGKNVCTLGQLIHNPQVVADLESKGVRVIDDISQANGSTVIIRTHGVPKNVIDELNAKGIDYCDATCPFVKKIHRIAEENTTPDNLLLIAGDKSHPEVCGIRGYAAGRSLVFGNCDELEEILKSSEDFCKKEIIVVSQTTFSVKEWEKCEKKIKIYCTNAKIFDTICNATQDRQNEAARLAVVCDAMISIGGHHSSNTVKLKKVCEELCPSFLIENADELDNIDLKQYGHIGVTAGASTPAGIIKEVLQKMSEILNENTNPINEEEVAGAAKEDLDFSAALEESLKKMNTDQKVKGIVTGIYPTEIQVDIGRKQTGYIPLDEYSADPTVNSADELKIGDELDLIIMKTNDAEGTIMLSKRRCDAVQAWNDIIAAQEDQRILEGTVVEVIRGGILVVCNGVRVFIPASLATASRNDSLEDMLKTKVKFRIIEVNKQRRRAVGSIRSVLRDLRKETSEAFWSQVAVGQTYHGTVKSLTNYGAFVDIGGVDGMIHISELSWKRIKHPSDVLKVGDEVDVYIKALDDENKKISLGYKKIEDNPWEILRRDYPVDSIVDAEIVGMTAFGAFARVIPGIDGLIHISQIANRHIAKPQDELKIGDVVKVKIIDIDFDKKRVSLSIRALLPEEPTEEAPVEEAPAEEAPAEEAPVEEAPVEEAPAEEAPAEEAPVEETPAEEAPAEEAPVEEAPAEEAPVEE